MTDGQISMTAEERAFAGRWATWEVDVFKPWASKIPAPMIARALGRQYRTTLSPQVRECND